MNPEDVALDPELSKLWAELRRLRAALRNHTRAKYKRVNPFNEDLFDWKEKGRYVSTEDKNITLYDSATVVGDVRIGENTWVGPFCSLDGQGGLTIGKNCSISGGVKILSHDTVRWALSGGKEPYDYKSIHIGDCCFIGADSIVTAGVTIGDHVMVMAGAVVTEDVPSFSIVGGVPARRVGKVIVRSGRVTLQYESKPRRPKRRTS